MFGLFIYLNYFYTTVMPYVQLQYQSLYQCQKGILNWVKMKMTRGVLGVCLSLYVHHMIFSHLLHIMSIFIVTASMSLYFTELKCSCASEGGEREAFQTHKRLVLAFITT